MRQKAGIDKILRFFFARSPKKASNKYAKRKKAFSAKTWRFSCDFYQVAHQPREFLHQLGEVLRPFYDALSTIFDQVLRLTAHGWVRLFRRVQLRRDATSLLSAARLR
jgi:hypothetical protein